MTKHFLPEPGATKTRTSEDNHRPVMSELESLVQANTESPKDVSVKWAWSERGKHFDKERSEEEAEQDSEKDSFEEDGKRLVRTKPRCNTDVSTAPWSNIQKVKDDCADEPCLHFRFRNFVIPSEVNRFRCTVTWTPVRQHFRDIVKSDWLWLFWQIWRFVDRVPFLADIGSNTVPEGLRDTTASESRARQERYSVTAPKNDSDILPRKPRNASPTREKDISRLNAWARYHRLNGSLEQLQTIYGKADGENNFEYPDDAGAEGGEKPEAKYPLDSTFENRPSVEEMKELWDVPTIKYETRTVRARGEARLSEDGYMATPIWRDMKISISGSVECIGYHKRGISDLKNTARESMRLYARKQADFRTRKTHFPRAKYAFDEKQIGIVVDRMATKPSPEWLNIADVDKSKPWSICRIGGLHFEPSDKTHRRLGQLTDYEDKNGIKHSVKVDVPRKARGPAYLGSANQKDNDDMRRNGWQPVVVAMRKTRMALLSGEEKAENRANEKLSKEWSRAELSLQLRVPLKDETLLCRDIYHRSRRVPPRFSTLPSRWLPAPYDTPVRRPLRAYAFGSTYTVPKEPADDVVERGSTLAAVNAMLTPQGLRVANALVLKDWNKPARNLPELGAMLWTDYENPSKSTLERFGQRVADETADELIVIFQILDAV